MDSTELLIKESVLPSALANAALLIAAPSLGCLNVYTKTFTDLCKAYDLHIPDLAHILLYNSMGLSSSSISKSKTEIQEPKPKQVEIKKEPEDFEGDTVRVKNEIHNKNPQNNACLYKTHPISQVASLDKHIKTEQTKLELPMDITLEIPLEIKDKFKVTNKKSSTQGTLLKQHIKHKDKPLEASFERKDNGKSNITPLAEGNVFDYKSSFKTDYNSNLLRDDTHFQTNSTSQKIRSYLSILSPKTSVNNIIVSTDREQSSPLSKKKLNCKPITSNKNSRVSLKDTELDTHFDRVLDKTRKNKQQEVLLNEGQHKLSSFEKKATIDKPNDTNPNMTITKFSGLRSNASILCPKTSVYSILDSTGFRQYATSSEEAKKIMFQCGMPMKFADGTLCSRDIKDCLVYVDTSMEDSICTSVLCIWLKDEDRAFKIPFANIYEISQQNIFNVRVYYSTLIKSVEHINLRPQETKSYSKKKNIVTTINWLQTFQG